MGILNEKSNKNGIVISAENYPETLKFEILEVKSRAPACDQNFKFCRKISPKIRKINIYFNCKVLNLALNFNPR